MDADGDDEGCRILNEVLQKNGDNVAKFIGDHHCKTLLVERALVGKDDDEEGADSAAAAGSREPSAEKSIISYQISVNVQFSSPRMSSVVFVKKGGVLEAEKSIAGRDS